MTGYWFTLLLCLLLTSFTSGLRIDSIYPRLGSLAGGTKVNVYGSGFSTDTYNSVNLIFLGSIPCTVISYTVTANRLECITEPYPDGEEGRSYSALQSTVISEGQSHTTTGSNDAFYYHWSYTPQIRKIDPSAGPVGTRVEVGGYRFTWDYDAYGQFFVGEQVCALRDPETNAQYGIRYKWSLLAVTCLTTEVIAGGWNVSMMISGSRGRSWNHSQALYPMYDWSLAMYELYPDVHSVWPGRGSPSGGTLLTIKGTGFAGVRGEIEVDVDGIPCQVVSHTSMEIKCWTGTPPLDSPAIADSNMEYPSTTEGFRFKGARGVRVHQYRGIGGSTVSNLHSANKYPDNPDRVYSLPSFSTGSDVRRHSSYGERLMAFFSPHSSGRHSFFLSNDDGAEVWLGAGSNITAAYQHSILMSPYATGFENYERHSYQRSESFDLDEGQDYLLIGEYKEGGGAEYLTVGALLHDDITFTYSETKQAVREQQRITLTSAGHYDVQTLNIAVNRSGVDEEAPPRLVLEWGGRESEPIPALDLEVNPGLVGEALLDLFSGQCEFDVNFGINHYPSPGGFDFEGGVRSDEVWSSWSETPPEITEEEALCGRHSLYIEGSRAQAFNLADDNGEKTSDYPFICLGYKLPPGHSMALAVNVKDYGWYSIPLSELDTGPFPFTVLSSFFDELYSSDTLIDDDRWHYSCTDLQFMLIDNLPLEEDESPARFHHILGMGFYSNPDPERRGFYVDEVSLSSEIRALYLDSYVAPARPNGRSLHQVITTSSNHSNNNTLNMTISLELVPSSCVNDLPLINVRLAEDTGVLGVGLERTQSASSPLEGSYTLTFDGQTTATLQYDASAEQIKEALEELSGVGGVTVNYDTTPLSHDLLGNFCPGRSYSVIFETTPGDLPLISVEEQYLTGDSVRTTVTETKTGGLFLRPIPGHMLQTVETTPQVHVRVRGQLAACSGGHEVYEEVLVEDHSDFCGFIYAPSVTPTVSTVTPTSAQQGDPITISGTGFSETPSENFVTFGVVSCNVTSSSNVEISCILGEGFGGYHELYLHVTSVGVADTGGNGISYEVSVDSVDVSVGSQYGGTAITISGSGFHSNDFNTGSESIADMYAQSFLANTCQNGWENVVTIGNNTCTITDSTLTTISCLTPGETGGAATYDITVSVGCRDNPSSYISALLSNGFTYDLVLTPSVSGVSPAEGSIPGGESIVISGSGFGDVSTLISVMIGGEECIVTSVMDTAVTCLTPAHTPGVWAVEVVVSGKGRAGSTVTFTYRLNITSISHCSGSLFGGQVLSIQGSGFGTDSDQVVVTLGDRSCDLTSLTDNEILCVTSPTTQTHTVDNNAEHPDYGLGYQWRPSTLTIHPGDTVQWSWTGSSFTARRGVAQVDLPGDTEYNGMGFRSGRSVTGSFSQTFTKPGVYRYIAEGYGHIGFNGTIVVSELENVQAPLSLTINSVLVDLVEFSPVCQQTTLPFTEYTYSVSHTPFLISTSPPLASPGESINFSLAGLSEQFANNVLVFGGRTPLACQSVDPMVVSTTSVTLDTTAAVLGSYDNDIIIMQCTLPDSIRPGDYRTILHVAGRGWASAVLEDTTLRITPRIDSSPQISSISLRGGVPLTFSTTGLLPSSITNTRVVIGNTPCVVQSIATDGELTCLTQAAQDDGYSSLILQSSPLAYWSLQADLPDGETDGIVSFRNGGSIDDSADAVITGSVMGRQEGISDNSVTDQAAFFESSYLLVPSDERFTRPASFAAEFWLKSDQISDKYRIVLSSVSYQDDIARGYIVLINSCNQLEFWVATGPEENQGSAGGQSSAEGQSSGHSSGQSLLGPDGAVCEVITDTSMCASSCIGPLTVPETSTLPSGTWHVIRNEQSDWSDWAHIYVSWTVEENELHTTWSSEDCTADNLCPGIQTVAINSDLTAARTTFLRSPDTQIEVGGSSSLPIWNPTAVVGDLTPFSGFLDEVAFYSKTFSLENIQDRVHFGSTEDQPIWLTVEGVDGIGTGVVPNVEYPEWDMAFTDEIAVNWDSVRDESHVLGNSTALRFDWTGIRAIREVSHSVYESCDLEAPYVFQWTPPTSGGQRSVWLDSGKTHYFIDSAVGGCLEGRTLSVQVGSTRTIEWRVGSYSDITLPQGTGLLFQWDGTVMHDVVEMSTPIESAGDCSKGQSSNRDQIGLVKREWLNEPAMAGEVFITDLSLGPHHFICSVGSHCALGMRFTVHVVASEDEEDEEINSQSPQSHTIPWRIQYYDDFTMVEGETLVFSWEGFHSLHQVTEEVFDSCDLSGPPLLEWGLPSVDNSASIDGLTPGDYYFLCAVAGHCDAGMKIRVTVLPSDGLPVLTSGVTAVCAEGVTCSVAYSSQTTPQLTAVEPSESASGTNLTLRGANLLPPGTMPGSPVSDITVLIDKSPCTNIAALTSDTDSDHMISCNITDYESNFYHVDLLVSGRGFASVTPTQLRYGPVRDQSISANSGSPYPKLFLTSVATALSPSSGSVNGGTLVTISGSGFSHITHRNTVSIGGVPCRIVESSSNTIGCVTGPGTSTVTLSANVNGFPVSTSLSYEYNMASTPEVTSISSSSNINSLSGGAVIEFSGTLLVNASSEVRVQIIPSDVDFVNFNTADECLANTFTSNLSTNVAMVTCTAPSKPAGSYKLLVHVLGYGFASVSDEIVGYALEVDSFSPATGGFGGGVVLTVDGTGFPELSPDSGTEQIGVTLCDGEAASTTCHVVVSTLNQLVCVLEASPIESPFSTNTSCTLTVTFGGQTQISSDSFEFSSSLTPRLDSVSPLIGGTGGGTAVTIEGEGLTSLTAEQASVIIDGVECVITASSDTSITCLTGSHTTTLQADVSVFIPGKGNALSLNGSVSYEYVDLWSSPFTWGGGPLPGEGDSVYIKTGQTVFLDIDTPVLNLLLIEGTLIFQDEQDLHLQANYIFINTGTLQVGTEESPFVHSATITLHGSVTDPEIPIYGAKVLGIRQGGLDLHGRPRAVTWTRLSQSALGNDTSLSVQERVDWVPGDRIVIAPTGKDGNETEENEVLSVSGDGHVITLLTPLKYTHHGVTDQYEDGHFIDIRAEVGLLSHNVIVQGSRPPPTDDEDAIDPQYGSQIFVHRTGPHPTPIRIEHTEVRYGGQAFRLGRYAVHFHLSGSMAGSYVRNCAIHHSNNRAITAHGVHDLLIEGNVAYDIKGHTYFVEDGIETNNRYLNNLGVLTRGSSSLLNTDQIPATFWITNPQNTFIGNAAAASRAYGFWFDFDAFPSGASRSFNVCPNKEPLGEFRGNTAHTCNEFGLRIWETYVPYADGCAATQPQVASLTDFTTYANGIHGVELSIVGHVRLIGFKVADNVKNGIEIIETLGYWGGPKVEDTLIISHTSVNTGPPQTGGLKTPNTPRLTVSNVTFVNFDLPTTSCLKACSHCKVRQGGFQVWFEELSFIGGSANHKAAFQWEYEVLYKDLDGTLTGLPDGGWVLPNSALVPPHHCTPSVPEFSINRTVINGTVCTNEVNFLRMAWNAAEPLATLESVAVSVGNEFGNSTIPWRHYRLTHLDGYMFTMPDGYEHRLVWDTPQEHRVDHTSYNAGVYGIRPGSRLWVTHEFIQTPDHVNVGGNYEPTTHQSLPTSTDPIFSWHLENETDPNTVTYLVSGHNLTDQNNNVTFRYSYEPCPRDGCPLPPVDYGPYESFQRIWSNPEHWPTGQIPQEGEDVTISSRWRMLLDVSPPTLGNVYILGELVFEDERDYNFTANLILIRGEMARVFIGTPEQPFTHNALITLNGRRDDIPLPLSRRLTFGSKGIGVFGNLTVHGVPKATWTRLEVSAMAGTNTLQLQGSDRPDWEVGDRIVIAPSGWEPAESEIRTITDYHQPSGTVTLDQALLYDHLVQPFLEQTDIDTADPPFVGGAMPWWGDGGTLNPEVGLLSHNIIIQGGEDPSEPLEYHHYGCRILVGEYFSGSNVFNGRLKIDSVEVRHCGQGGFFSPRDPRYSIAFANGFETTAGSYIRRCSVHHGYNTAIGIHSSYGIEISQNVIWRTVDSGLKVGGRNNVIIDNLAMLTSTIQPNRPSDNHAVDFPAMFDVDGGNIVRGNAAAGSNRIAFSYAGEPCLEGNTSPTHDEAMFWGNTAHSGLMGLVVLGLPRDCTCVGGFTATHQWNYGVFSSTASSLVTTHLKIGAGKVGLNLNVFGPNPVAHLLGNKFISISDSLIIGSLPGESCVTRPPSFLPPSVSFKPSDLQMGVMMSSFNQKRSKMDGTGPWHLMKGYPVIDGVVNMNNISFARFFNSDCNYNMVAIANNPLSPDAVHPIHMSGTNKLNVDLNNLAFFYEPSLEWIVQEDCVDMDCDGPKHALIRDNDGRFVNTQPSLGSIIPFAELRFANYSHRLPVTWLGQDREGATLARPEELLQHRGIARGETGNLDSSAGGCEWMGAWQGYRCKSLRHHMLVIESLDEDTETRRLSPLALNGGDTGAGHYTDLINGPMDHGWCVYYTCLKRLSTFFTVVAVGTDYCVWMTGSPPTQLRFHLLNAGPDDVISMCIFFKDTRRKDVYKSNIFIEPENVRYLEGGGVQQTDGSYRPNREGLGGANYFERQSQILHLIVRGSDPIEIRTPPVVQVSLSLAVSLDDFFNVGELIRNLAFVLKISPDRIRVVEIVSENPAQRSRRSLLAVQELNHTTITIELGNPPAPNITTTPPPTVAEEIMMAGETNDSVDLEDNTANDTPLIGTNPFNEDPPESVDSFADSFNVSVTDFLEDVDEYEQILEEVQEVNELAGEVVDLVLTGNIANITNATVTGLSVIPASPPPAPPPPVVPPVYENATTDEGDPVIIPVEEVIDLPTVTTPENNDTTGDMTASIDFVIPSEMRVTQEPLSVTSHLVHVVVTVFDDRGRPVPNLGLVNPWLCQASLLHQLGDKDPFAPRLGGVTSVPFVRGVAEFTRLRVDRPGVDLTLQFRTIPSRFQATTSVSFQVVEPLEDSAKEKIRITLEGDISAIPSDQELSATVLEGLSEALDVDISRIESLTVEETNAGLVVVFELLDRQPSDPPDVLGLRDTIASLMRQLDSNTFKVSVSDTTFTGVRGSFEYVTPPPPVSTVSVLEKYRNLFIAIGSTIGLFLLLSVGVVCFLVCTRRSKKGGKKKKNVDEGRIPLYPIRKVTPMPPRGGESDMKRVAGDQVRLFVRESGTNTNKRGSPSTNSEEEWSEGVTDETSLGPRIEVELSDVERSAVDCWEVPSPQQVHPPHLSPRGMAQLPKRHNPVSIAALANNLNRAGKHQSRRSNPLAGVSSGNHGNQHIGHHPVNKQHPPKRHAPHTRAPMSPGWDQ